MAKWQYNFFELNGMPLMGEVEELSGRCGEGLLAMERYRMPGRKDQGAIALVLDLAKAFRAGQSPSCMGMGDAFQLFQG